jgi:octanoyl-[GcvH]:protein N-octanoyltransferase
VDDLVPGVDVAAVEDALLATYAHHATLRSAAFTSLGA